MVRDDALGILTGLPEEAVRLLVGAMAEADAIVFEADWASWVREGQSPPGGAWRQWVMLAGRGFGKTRAGAEYVLAFARDNPGALIALVGATAHDARAVMVEGPSGLLAAARADERAAMRWLPSLRRLVFASGAEATIYSAANPEALRGPEHHLAWCDELAKWPGSRRSGQARADAAWNNLRLGLRRGERPRAIITTTPRPGPLLKRLLADPATVVTGGPSRANPHIAEDFLRAVEEAHGGTRFGRQELEGKLLDDLEGALWSRELIERSRGPLHHGSPDGCHAAGSGYRHAPGMPTRLHPPPPEIRGRTGFSRVVVGVDPPASAEGTCGIVVCGLGADGIGYVLADCSAGGLPPDGWARKVAGAAEAWGAHRVVAEANNGGRMVETVLRGAEAGLPVTLVHAADGKTARAEPVMVAFENGRARLMGRFPELEDELAGLIYGGDYRGPGGSPDRADAMVWALTELLVKPKRAAARIRLL